MALSHMEVNMAEELELRKQKAEVRAVVSAPGIEIVARRVIVKSPEVKFVKSRLAHRAAIKQWKLRRVQLGF
jgi:hypothetical protein